MSIDNEIYTGTRTISHIAFLPLLTKWPVVSRAANLDKSLICDADLRYWK